MTGRRTASNDCPASRRWASGNLCRFTRRSSAHVAPKRHTAPRARLQAFSVISSEWRKPPAGQVRERWQDLWPFFASSLHQLRRGTMKHTFTSIAVATALSVSALASAAPPDDAQAIRPLHVHVPNAELVDLRKRLAATRWPDRETVEDTSQGVQLATIQALVEYWGTQYDWRKVESELNSLPQFTTKIDGVDIYFIHVRSRHPNALPVIITHGWPGSVIEQLKIIGPLTDPSAHGGRAE